MLRISGQFSGLPRPQIHYIKHQHLRDLDPSSQSVACTPAEMQFWVGKFTPGIEIRFHHIHGWKCPCCWWRGWCSGRWWRRRKDRTGHSIENWGSQTNRFWIGNQLNVTAAEKEQPRWVLQASAHFYRVALLITPALHFHSVRKYEIKWKLRQFSRGDCQL